MTEPETGRIEFEPVGSYGRGTNERGPSSRPRGPVPRRLVAAAILLAVVSIGMVIHATSSDSKDSSPLGDTPSPGDRNTTALEYAVPTFDKQVLIVDGRAVKDIDTGDVAFVLPEPAAGRSAPVLTRHGLVIATGEPNSSTRTLRIIRANGDSSSFANVSSFAVSSDGNRVAVGISATPLRANEPEFVELDLVSGDRLHSSTFSEFNGSSERFKIAEVVGWVFDNVVIRGTNGVLPITELWRPATGEFTPLGDYSKAFLTTSAGVAVLGDGCANLTRINGDGTVAPSSNADAFELGCGSTPLAFSPLGSVLAVALPTNGVSESIEILPISRSTGFTGPFEVPVPAQSSGSSRPTGSTRWIREGVWIDEEVLVIRTGDALLRCERRADRPGCTHVRTPPAVDSNNTLTSYEPILISRSESMLAGTPTSLSPSDITFASRISWSASTASPPAPNGPIPDGIYWARTPLRGDTIEYNARSLSVTIQQMMTCSAPLPTGQDCSNDYAVIGAGVNRKVSLSAQTAFTLTEGSGQRNWKVGYDLFLAVIQGRAQSEGIQGTARFFVDLPLRITMKNNEATSIQQIWTP